MFLDPRRVKGGTSIYFTLAEPETASALVDELKPGDLFFDIGANRGYFTAFASRLVENTGSGIAFEPMVRNLGFLQKHLTLNNLEHVSIVAAGCSEDSGIGAFSAGPNCAQGQLAEESEKWEPGGQVTLVPIITVDAGSSLIKRYPNLMKIDLEGAELPVLEGARRTLEEGRPRGLLEVHSNSLKPECVEYLQKFAYAGESLEMGAGLSEMMVFRPS